MSQPAQPHGSDMGAAFAGLIGGMVFIAIVVYALVVWTNNRFDAHEGDHAVIASPTVQLVA